MNNSESKISPWNRICLDEVCELIVDCVNRTAPVVDYVTPFRMIRTTDVKNGRIDLSNSRYVTKEVYRKWTRRGVPRIGDVVLTREAPLGEVGIIREENVFLGQRTMMFRTDSSKLISQFLLYSFLMSDLQSQIRNYGMGSTVEHMRVPDAKKLTIPLPPLPEQRAIAAILGSLDDKIELNRRQNETLEAMARALFKSWFVDFDPVRAKQEGRQPSGMDEETAALFPDGFEESALGDIPRGWRVGCLGDLGKIITGKTPSTEFPEYFGGNTPFITPRDMDGRKVIGTTERYLTEQGCQSVRSARVPARSVIVSCIGSDMGKVACTAKDSVTNQQINSIIPDEQSFPEYLYYNLRERQDELKVLASGGSAIPILNKGHFSQIEILIPHRSILNVFAQHVEALTEKMVANDQEVDTLATIRDALLPKLLSGEIRVGEVE